MTHTTFRLPGNIDPGDRELVTAFRQLEAGAPLRIGCRVWDDHKRRAADFLVLLGWAVRESDGGPGKYEVLTFTPSGELTYWKTQTEAARLSFNAASEAWGKAFPKRFAKPRTSGDRPKAFPAKTSVLTQAIKTGAGINEDDEVSGRALTDWYVETFCKLNGLKGG